jgi:hypothetical protein
VNTVLQLSYKQLYSAYREAWMRFSAQVAQFELLSSHPHEKDALENARKRVECVELSYREHRNALATFLLSDINNKTEFGSSLLDTLSRATNFADGRTSEFQFAVRLQAHRFWEEGGRQDGQAASDWSRAESYLWQCRTAAPEYAATEAAA